MYSNLAINNVMEKIYDMIFKIQLIVVGILTWYLWVSCVFPCIMTSELVASIFIRYYKYPYKED